MERIWGFLLCVLPPYPIIFGGANILRACKVMECECLGDWHSCWKVANMCRSFIRSIGWFFFLSVAPHALSSASFGKMVYLRFFFILLSFFACEPRANNHAIACHAYTSDVPLFGYQLQMEYLMPFAFFVMLVIARTTIIDVRWRRRRQRKKTNGVEKNKKMLW